jgi:hypothetical protein
LTGQESGLIIFHDKEVMICNWSSFNGIPRLFTCNQIISLEDEIPACLMDETWNETEIMGYLQDKKLIYSDLKEELNIQKSKVFHLDEAVTILAPEGWA